MKKGFHEESCSKYSKMVDKFLWTGVIEIKWDDIVQPIKRKEKIK